MELHPINVSIKAFQSIEDLSFEIVGFTCITGKSNIGKSAIIRAISRSIMNANVVGLVRKGHKFSTVEVTSENWKYKWEKGEGSSGINRYTIGEDRLLDKTGQLQIAEIKNMGFGSIKIGDDNIHPWWASQFDPIFLLNKSGPHVTDFITEVSRLKTLQGAIAQASKLKNKQNDIAKLKTEDVRKTKERQSKIENFDIVNKASFELDEQLESINAYEKKLSELNGFTVTINTAEKKLELLNGITSIKIPKIDTATEQKIESLTSMYTYWNKLEIVARSIIAVKAIKQVIIPTMPDINSLQSLISFSGIIELKKLVDSLININSIKVPDLSGLKEKINDLNEKYEFLDTIQKATKSVNVLENVDKIRDLGELPVLRLQEMVNHFEAIKQATDLLHSSELELQALNSDIEKLEKELAEIPVCPSCKRPTSENHENHENVL